MFRDALMETAARVFFGFAMRQPRPIPRVPFGRRLWNARLTPMERSGGSSPFGSTPGLAAPSPAASDPFLVALASSAPAHPSHVHIAAPSAAHYPTPLAGPSFVRAYARARSGKPTHSFGTCVVNAMGLGVCGCLWATAYYLPASKSAMSSEDELSSLSANRVSGEVQATQEELDQLRAVQEREAFRRATMSFLRSKYARITHKRILEERGPCPVR